MNWLLRICRAIDRLNETIGRLVMWLTLALVVLTCAVATLRYLFALGAIAVQEVATYLHALLFMLGAAYTLKHDGHVRVDLFYNSASPRTRDWIDLLGVVLLLLPVCGFLFWISWEYVAASWSLREGSREVGGLNLVWLLKGVILAMPVLVGLQGFSQAGHSLARITGHLPPGEVTHG